jgi:hypothetical protein
MHSMKAECLVRVKEDQPEVQRKRQEMVRAMTPVELAKMSSPADFPIPSPIVKMLGQHRSEIWTNF